MVCRPAAIARGGAAILVLVLLLTSCTRARLDDGTVPVVGSAELPSNVTLAPQTIVIKDGARAVKSLSADGATIALNADAAGAADIKPGSVVLIRDVVVVKAAAIHHDGDSLVISAEPAAITEVIQNGEINWSRAKVDFRRGTIHTSTPSNAPAVHGRRSMPSAPPIVALFLPPLGGTADGESFSGKLKDFAYDGSYSAASDLLRADVHLYGEIKGVTVDITAKGRLSNFEFGGRIAIRDGKADNLNLLLDKLDGEVDVQATVSRAAGGDHPGQQLLEIPQEYNFPIVIDGIPFVVTFKFALLLNEGITNVGGRATVAAHLKLHGSQGAEWRLPGEPKAEPVPKGEGDTSLDFDLTRSEGAGLGPQALLVAVQYPWLGFGLGFGAARAGPFVDVVTAASTTYAGAAAIFPCSKGDVYITGSVGLEAKFLLLKKNIRTTVYQKNIHRFSPNIKACQ
jgi:hypothetical protein